MSRPVALITGASSGIGRATALHLAGQGYALLIHHRDSSEAAEAVAQEACRRGGEALVAGGDVACDEVARRLVQLAVERWGRLDALVNNAATTTFLEADQWDRMEPDQWQRIFAVNATGPYLMARASAGWLRQARGAVVNISSTSGLSGLGSCPAYAASKAALNNLTLSLARALAPEVRVNAVLPGFVDTRWVQQGLGSRYPRARRRVEQSTPLGAVVQPEQVAEVVASLLQGMSQVTGQLLVVDGGFHL